MKRNQTVIAGLIIAGVLAGSAFAQGGRMPGNCDGMGPMGMGPMAGQATRQGSMKFDPAQRADRHLAIMKDTLKITAEQEPLWQAYAEQMKSHAAKGPHAMRMQAPDEKLTAPERMAKMQTLMEEHLVAMKSVHESFNRLYAGLTPEQKTTADQFAARMGQGKPARDGKPRGPGMGPGSGAGGPPQKPQS